MKKFASAAGRFVKALIYGFLLPFKYVGSFLWAVGAICVFTVIMVMLGAMAAGYIAVRLTLLPFQIGWRLIGSTYGWIAGDVRPQLSRRQLTALTLELVAQSIKQQLESDLHKWNISDMEHRIAGLEANVYVDKDEEDEGFEFTVKPIDQAESKKEYGNAPFPLLIGQT